MASPTTLTNALQNQLNTILTPPTAGEIDFAKLLQENPGIAAEYASEASRDKKSKANLAKLGINNAEDYARWWWSSGLAPAGFTPPRVSQAAVDAASPEKTTQSLIEQLTSSSNTALSEVSKGFAEQLTALKDQNTSLLSQITSQSETFSKSQADLLDKMNTAMADNAKALKDLLNQQGTQTAKKPDYAKALAANKALNNKGIGSTDLTGPMGAPLTALNLSRTSLTGA